MQKVAIKARGGEAVTIPAMATSTTTEINYYKLDDIDVSKIIASMKSLLMVAQSKLSSVESAETRLKAVLCEEEVMAALIFGFTAASLFKRVWPCLQGQPGLAACPKTDQVFLEFATKPAGYPYVPFGKAA